MENNYKAPELMYIELDASDVITASVQGVETSLRAERDGVWKFN